MSRLMAAQEKRGGNNGDPGAGEKDSVMRVNLAEGGWAVNEEGMELPGALLARRTRTLGRCSFDARSKGQPCPLP